MAKSIYATERESASFMKPDTRTNAEKILYELQKEQTNGFEMGHDVDNGAIALKVIERNLELLEALKLAANALDKMGDMPDYDASPDAWFSLGCENIVENSKSLIAKSTGQSK